MNEFEKARKAANTDNAVELEPTITKEGAVIHTNDGDISIPLMKLGQMYTKALELYKASLAQERNKLVEGLDFKNAKTYDPNELRYNRSR